MSFRQYEKNIIVKLTLTVAALLLCGCGDSTSPGSVTVVQTATSCSLGLAPCKIELPGLSGEVSLDRQAKYLQPFGMTVSLQGSGAVQVQSVTVRLNMTGMDMSLPVNRLNKTPTGDWQGELMVPVCSSGRNDWVVDVEILAAKGRFVFQYKLIMH